MPPQVQNDPALRSEATVAALRSALEDETSALQQAKMQGEGAHNLVGLEVAAAARSRDRYEALELRVQATSAETGMNQAPASAPVRPIDIAFGAPDVRRPIMVPAAVHAGTQPPLPLGSTTAHLSGVSRDRSGSLLGVPVCTPAEAFVPPEAREAAAIEAIEQRLAAAFARQLETMEQKHSESIDRAVQQMAGMAGRLERAEAENMRYQQAEQEHWEADADQVQEASELPDCPDDYEPDTWYGNGKGRQEAPVGQEQEQAAKRPEPESILPKLSSQDLVISKHAIKCPRYDHGSGIGQLHSLSEWITKLRNYILSAFPRIASGFVTVLLDHIREHYNTYLNAIPAKRYAIKIPELEGLSEYHQSILTQITPVMLSSIPTDCTQYATMEATDGERETRLVDGLFKLWQRAMPGTANEWEAAKTKMQHAAVVAPNNLNGHLYEFEISLRRLETLGVYEQSDSYAALHHSVVTAISSGYGPGFLHSYRTWLEDNHTPIKIDREYFRKHLELVKGLSSLHHSTRNYGPPKAKANTATAENPAKAAAAKAGKPPKGGAKGKAGNKGDGKPKGKKGEGKGGKGSDAQCTRCSDKAHKHVRSDCPHSGRGKGLKCKVCESETHASAACWVKHPELKVANTRPRKGEKQGAQKPQGNGKPRPAGQAPTA